jgi:hypothetical protein
MNLTMRRRLVLALLVAMWAVVALSVLRGGWIMRTVLSSLAGWYALTVVLMASRSRTAHGRKWIPYAVAGQWREWELVRHLNRSGSIGRIAARAVVAVLAANAPLIGIANPLVRLIEHFTGGRNPTA